MESARKRFELSLKSSGVVEAGLREGTLRLTPPDMAGERFMIAESRVVHDEFFHNIILEIG